LQKVNSSYNIGNDKYIFRDSYQIEIIEINISKVLKSIVKQENKMHYNICIDCTKVLQILL